MEQTPEMKKLVQSIFEERMKAQKAEKVERYRRLNKFARKGQILFVGSSLMEQFPVNELLMDRGSHLTVYNRGIGGFTTAELAEVLDVCVYELEPAHIFINIGTNDLNGPDYSFEGLMERYENILAAIKARLPRAKLYLLAYYPVNEPVGERNPMMKEIFRHRTNERIREANRGVEALAEKMGARYLDLNRGITDPQGRMKEEYTIEGMHMYGDGYVEVLDRLMPLLEELGS